MKIHILASAFDDLHNGREFYELQEIGAGEYFLKNLISDIDSLALNGGIHRKVFGYHRLLSKRFPYAIYYRMNNPEEIVVYRVLDCRRNPRSIRRSLD